MSDQDFLKEAIKEGNKLAAPFNFGAVVVKDGKIIGAGHPHVFEKHDPSAHSEVSAMRAAGKCIKSYNLEGCTLYSSHEPCTMCLSCAAWAGIERIVFVLPASFSKDVMYEFSKPDIFNFSSQLRKPIKIEQHDIK